mgnify:CR=1 FL=1|tara:strand:- start:1858 stop:2292 length:435 start_codon:yes stop_codon:yes gene_type:complete
MIEFNIYASLFFALLALVFNKKKYSSYFSISSLLLIIIAPLLKVETELAVVFLIILLVFEITCFVLKNSDYHLFKEVKVSRYKVLWLVICVTIIFSLLVTLTSGGFSFNISRLNIEKNFYILILPIAYFLFEFVNSKIKGDNNG